MANLLVNSHYKMPWAVYKREYSFTVSSGGIVGDQKIAHNLPFTPLLVGSWSTNSSFSPSYDLGISIPGGSSGGNPETMLSIFADSSNIIYTALNNSASSKTFYLRLMAFALPDYTGEVTPVEYNSPFRFNSLYRYQKIYMAGRASSSVSHNLGYIPQAKVWGIDSSTNRVFPTVGTITTSTLAPTSTTSAFYYHIYKDRLDG